MKTLALTSPYTTGPDVVMAQAALKSANIFRADYLVSRLDGVFGEATARGCKRAKWWLGYAEKDCTPIYGDQLHAYLKGTKDLSLMMRRRRSARQKAAAVKPPLRARALSHARTKLGMKERTGHNDIYFTDWYGIRGPWCAMFVSWAYHSVGSKSFKPGLTGVDGLHPGSGTYAYVPYIVNDARAGRNGLAVVSYANVQPGDLVCYDWNGNGIADHVGLFEKKTEFPGEFFAIEGNTAIGNDSNGGEVMRRRRPLPQVQVFVRVSR